VRHIVKYLPEPPAPEDPDALQKASSALTEYIRMFIRMSLRQGFMDPAEPHSGLEHAIFVLFTRELSSPRAESEPDLLDATQAHMAHVNQCLRILRPDLNQEDIFRMGMSIHGQLLFFFNHQRIVSLLRGEPYQDFDLEPLVEHLARFSLLGANADDFRFGAIP
jgi:HTH-type transcriptional dual regulator CecR, C-terminal domain